MKTMRAAAKINLDLRVTGRRGDGYHLLDSIVAFTEFGDDVSAERSDGLSLRIEGAFSSGLSETDNLIMDAARLLCAKAGVEPNIKFHLTKNLPLASGIGGGSADAAAALKLTNELLGLEFDEGRLDELALEIGADVPVCLRSKTSRMCGIGENITPIRLVSDIYVLLVNPGISVSTPDVFRSFHASDQLFEGQREQKIDEIHLPLRIDYLKSSTNSLQHPACVYRSEIGTVIDVLSQTEGALLSRMSGSGATCFALYEKDVDCAHAAREIASENPTWWVKATRFIE